MTLDSIKNGISSALVSITDNKIPLAIGAGVIGLGSAVAIGSIVRSKAKAKTRKASSKRGRNRDRLFKSKEKHERKYKRKRKYKRYGRKGYIHPKRKKRKMKSKKGIHYTKNGQPYKIMSNGRARFIKRKGGKN